MIYVINASSPSWSWSSIFVVEAENRVAAIKKVRSQEGHEWDTHIQIASQNDDALEPIRVHCL